MNLICIGCKQTMDLTLNQKKSSYKVALLLLATLFCTYLRVSLLFVYPALVVTLYYLFNWKLDRNAIFLLGFVLLCWLISFRNGFYLTYNLLSFYYFFPFMLLLFAVPPKRVNGYNYLRLLMKALTILVIFNNIPGIIQYAVNPGDDNFVGIYGKFTVSQNGLSVLNAILFFYYFICYQYSRKPIHILLAGFFLICCVMGFYGAGQMVLIAALMLTYLKIRVKNIVQLILFTCLTVGVVVLLMKIISPVTLDYNINIIKIFLIRHGPGAPRKITVFENYFTAYFSHPLDLLFGSGPGTFNSRSAFMIGSPYYFSLDFIKSDSKPFFFQNYAYPLWNNTNTGPYDGFMNQPFTSILALLGEYGLLLTGTTIYLILRRFNYYNRLSAVMDKKSNISVEAKMFRFCTIYAFLLIIIDNYMEYPEIIGILLIIIIFSLQQLRKAFNV